MAAKISSVRAARGVRLTGRVTGAKSGKVTLVVERQSGRRWARTARVTMALGTGGSFTRSFRPKRGLYRVQARFLGTELARPSRSAYQRFRAR